MSITPYVFSSSLREFLSPRRALPWLAVVILVVALSYLWQQSANASQPVAERYAQAAGVLAFRVLALISAVYSTAVIAGEVEQRTIVYLLTRPIPRPSLLLGRALASIVAVGILGTIAIIAMAGAILGSAAFQPMVFRDVLLMWAAAAAYGGLFVFISLLLNRAIVYCLLFAFGWESFVPNMPGDLYYASIHSHLRSLTLHPREDAPAAAANLALIQGGGAQSSVQAVPTAVALSVLAGFFLVGLALSAVWFNSFEFTPREDAA